MFAKAQPRRLAPTLALAAFVLYPALAHAQAAELKPARIEYEFYPGSRVSGLSRTGEQSNVHFQSARVSLSIDQCVRAAASASTMALSRGSTQTASARPPPLARRCWRNRSMNAVLSLPAMKSGS